MKPSKSLKKMGLNIGPVKFQQDSTSIGWLSAAGTDPLAVVRAVLKAHNQGSQKLKEPVF
jgi:hypothetical protein